MHIEEAKNIGYDPDEHGCNRAAGLSWCEVSKKCIQPWEEKCESASSIPWGWIAGAVLVGGFFYMRSRRKKFGALGKGSF